MRCAIVEAGCRKALAISSDVVLAFEHSAAAQMIQGAVLGARHQPSAGFFRNACHRPVLKRGQQSFLR
jgi:hypothetical protein